METVKSLKLAEMAIQAIENLVTEKESPMHTGMGKFIAIETVINRYKFYKLHPEQIPPHIMDILEIEQKFYTPSTME